MQTILDQIRAEIAAAEQRVRRLKMAEAMLKSDMPMSSEAVPNAAEPDFQVPISEPKPVLGSITEAIQAQLGESGPMTKGSLERALSASRSLRKQTVSAALQAMKKRGTVKLMKGGKWKMS